MSDGLEKVKKSFIFHDDKRSCDISRQYMARPAVDVRDPAAMCSSVRVQTILKDFKRLKSASFASFTVLSSNVTEKKWLKYLPLVASFFISLGLTFFLTRDHHHMSVPMALKHHHTCTYGRLRTRTTCTVNTRTVNVKNCRELEGNNRERRHVNDNLDSCWFRVLFQAGNETCVQQIFGCLCRRSSNIQMIMSPTANNSSRV